jgi:hypothetical protein
VGIDIAQLGIQITTKGVDEAPAALNKVTAAGKQAEAQSSSLSSTFDKLGYSTGGLVKYVEAAAAAFGLMKLAELIKDASLLAARYETLGVVVQVIGKTAGYTASQMADFQKGLQKTGISAIEARAGLALMGQAQIDFANSSKLARIAQDAAVIGNINSSEAFNRMMTGLATGQSILLHHLGLMTNFEQAYTNAAHAAGKTTAELSDNEKAQVRVNEVIRAGVGIAGSYEAAMGTVGKQLTSMPRYIQDFMVKVGEMGQGALFAGVKGISDSLKWMTTNFEQVSTVVSNVFTGALIFSLSKLIPLAEGMAIVSQHTQALSMNTLFGATASVKSAEAKAWEAVATVDANKARLVAIDTVAAEAKANFWGTNVIAERIVAENTLIAAETRRGVITGELAASVALQAEAELAASVAASRLAIAQTEATFASRALAGASAMLGGALSLVGGVYGAVAIAIGTVVYGIYKLMTATDELAKKQKDFEEGLPFAKTLKALQEQKELIEQMQKQVGMTPEQKAADTARLDGQKLINKATADNIVLQSKLAKEENSGAINWAAFGVHTEADKIRAEIADNDKRIIQGKAAIAQGIEQTEVQTKLNAARKATPPVTTPVNMQDADEYGKLLRHNHETYLAYVDEYEKAKIAIQNNARDVELNSLKGQKDLLLITERDYQAKVMQAKDEAARQAVIIDQKRFDTAVAKAAEINAALPKHSDGTYGNTSPDAVSVADLNKANKEVEALRITLDTAKAKAAMSAQDLINLPKINTLADQKMATDNETLLLQTKGLTIQAQEWQNEVKYADLKQKGYSDELINQLKVIDNLSTENALWTQQSAIRNALAAGIAANNATAASMVGTNASGGFDTIADQTANQMAVQKQAHEERLRMIEVEQEANIHKVQTERQALEAMAALDQKTALEKQKNSQAVTKIAEMGYKSQLAEAANYTGMAGQMFGALANTIDQSSRSGFESAKALNLAAAVMTTAAAIMNAFATVPWPASIAAAALAATTGAIQIATIASTSFGGGAVTPSVPTGSFSGSGSGGSIGGSIGAPISSVHDSQSQADLSRIAGSMENASLAIGKVADGLTVIADLFKSGGFMSLASGTLVSAGLSDNSTGMLSKLKTGMLAPLMPDFSSVQSILDSSIRNTILPIFGNALSSIFGGGQSVTGQGLSLGLSGGAVSANNYTNIKTSGGWFGSDSTSTNYSGNSNMQAVVQSVINSIAGTISRGAVATGTTADFGQASLAPANIATAGRTAADISKDLQSWLESASNELAKTVTGLKDFAFYGENAFDALVRLSTALQSTNEGLSLIGANLITSTLSGANAAYKLQDLMGGADKFTSTVDGYFTAMFTTQEQAAAKAAQASRQVSAAFAEMGIAAPTTKEGFKSLVDSLNLATDSGASTFAALMNISTAFATVQDQIDKLATATATFNDDLAKRAMVLVGIDTTLFDLRLNQEAEMKQAALDGMDTGKLAIIQNEEWAAAVAKATGVVTNSITSLIDAAKTAATSMVDALLAIANTKKTIETGPLANLSPEALYMQAQAKWAALQGKTDLASMQALPQAANDLLNASKTYNASGKGYQTDLANVLAALDAVLPTGTGTTESQIQVLQDIRAALTTGTLVTSLGATGVLAGLLGAFNTDMAAKLQADKVESARQTQIKLDAASSAVTTNQAIMDTLPGLNIMDGILKAKLAKDQAWLAGGGLGVDLAGDQAKIAANQKLIDAAALATANMPGLISSVTSLADTLAKIVASYIIPAHASGGLYAGGLALVGERGPELINFNSAGYVHTAAQTRSIMQNGSADNSEELAELRAIRDEIKALVGVSQYGFTGVIANTGKQAKASESIATSARQAVNQ